MPQPPLRLIIGCLCLVIAGAFPPHGAKAADSSLPLHPDNVIGTTKSRFFSSTWAGKIIWGEIKNTAFTEILNDCFLTPSPQSKAVTCQTDDVSEPCLPTGISILSAESQVAALTRSVWRHQGCSRGSSSGLTPVTGQDLIKRSVKTGLDIRSGSCLDSIMRPSVAAEATFWIAGEIPRRSNRARCLLPPSGRRIGCTHARLNWLVWWWNLFSDSRQ